jgi:hypothetical protein
MNAVWFFILLCFGSVCVFRSVDGILGRKYVVGVTMIIIIISGMLLVLNRNQSRFPFRKHCLLTAVVFFIPFFFLQALQFLGKGTSRLFSRHHLQSHFHDLGNNNLFSVMSGTMSYFSSQFYKPWFLLCL